MDSGRCLALSQLGKVAICRRERRGRRGPRGGGGDTRRGLLPPLRHEGVKGVVGPTPGGLDAHMRLIQVVPDPGRSPQLEKLELREVEVRQELGGRRGARIGVRESAPRTERLLNVDDGDHRLGQGTGILGVLHGPREEGRVVRAASLVVPRDAGQGREVGGWREAHRRAVPAPSMLARQAGQKGRETPPVNVRATVVRVVVLVVAVGGAEARDGREHAPYKRIVFQGRVCAPRRRERPQPVRRPRARHTSSAGGWRGGRDPPPSGRSVRTADSAAAGLSAAVRTRPRPAGARRPAACGRQPRSPRPS
mmetsp:Transcript_35951/g.112878  ORF Transcript_35951/g.112878 Transcript_35951/m.112878 type:complete len:308 (-) Transcript_35951:1847-2770(-)